MKGTIKSGTPVDVYTGGWWKRAGLKLQSLVEPFTAGWFAEIIGINLPQTTQYVYFIAGRHKTEIKQSNDFRNMSMLPSYMTQKCSSLYDGERELLQVVNQEAITKFGIPVEYYYLGYDEDKKNVDYIFGEYENRFVLDVWDNVMFWYKLQRENRVWSKFGIDAADTFTIVVPKAHFMHVTGGYVPQAGDLFIEKSTGRIMEILEREEGEPFATYYQSRQYNWELKATLYTREEFIDFNEKTKNSRLARDIKIRDINNNKNEIYLNKDIVNYKPAVNEEPQKNPFGVW
jgi:hypothetical protein